MNLLLALTVLFALALSLNRGGGEEANADFASAVMPLSAVTPIQTPSPGKAYRAWRRESRREQQAALQTLIGGTSTVDALRRQAESMILETAKRNEIELAVEAALAAWGDPEAVCAAREGGVNVFLSRELTEAQAQLLLEIASEASGLPRENIRLSGF